MASCSLRLAITLSVLINDARQQSVMSLNFTMSSCRRDALFSKDPFAR